MNYNQQFMTAVSECEAASRNHGHTLSVWHLVDERLHTHLCEVCGTMGWVARSGGEKRWRIGGAALKQDCLEYYGRGSLSGAE